MNDYYDYENGQSDESSADYSKEELKAKAEQAKKAQQELKKALKAEKKKKREEKRKIRKAKGTTKKIGTTVGLAFLFGIVAAVVFRVSNSALDKMFGKNVEVVASAQAEDRVNEVEEVTETIKEDEEPKEQAPATEDTDKNQKKAEAKVVNSDHETTGYSVEEVVKETMPSIVAITNKSVQEVMTMYGMGVQQYETESAGSGIIIGQNDEELLIATNAHVVQDANTLTVCFINEEANEAKIKGADTDNDLAIIAVDLSDISGSTLDAIRIATLGNSDELNIGEQVVAIGNALGYGQSVTTGIVSALDRTIDGTKDGTNYIQTDAAINPGNSGGALLNMSGELIGINSAKLANTKIEGMGYAIPISMATPIIDDLMNMKTRTLVDEDEAGYLGISGFSVTDEVAAAYNIPKGIYISEANPGGAADKAGIQKGDVIIKFDGMGMDSINKLKERLGYYKAGEVVDVIIARADNGEYQEKTIQVILDKRERSSGKQKSDDSAQPDGPDNNGNQGGQRSGEFNFGGNQFQYSLPEGLFDIFGFN